MMVSFLMDPERLPTRSELYTDRWPPSLVYRRRPGTTLGPFQQNRGRGIQRVDDPSLEIDPGRAGGAHPARAAAQIDGDAQIGHDRVFFRVPLIAKPPPQLVP